MSQGLKFCLSERDGLARIWREKVLISRSFSLHCVLYCRIAVSSEPSCSREAHFATAMILLRFPLQCATGLATTCRRAKTHDGCLLRVVTSVTTTRFQTSGSMTSYRQLSSAPQQPDLNENNMLEHHDAQQQPAEQRW